MKNWKRITLFWMLIFIPVIMLSSCTTENQVTDSNPEVIENLEVIEESPARDTLLIGLGRDFYYGPEDRTFLHGSTNVWESLVYLDANLNAQPWLASDFYPSEDGRIWTFALQEGIKFHDGSIMNAEVVKDNLQRLSKHPGTAQPYSELVDIRVVDDLTIEVELAVPMPAFPEMISYFPCAIFSPLVLNEENNGLTEPIGTGPYKFEEYGNDQITLAAFNEYWNGKPEIDKVIFKYIPDANTRVAALLAGEVDVLADVGVILPEQVPLLEVEPSIEIMTVEVLTTIYMHFQTESEPFHNSELRRAVTMLLDREELVATMLEGIGRPAQGVITPLAEYWINPASTPAYDPDEATALINRHLQGNTNIKLLVNTAWTARWPMLSIAQYLQTELNARGFNAEILSLEAGAYNDAVKTGDYNITFTPWTGSDPDDFFRTWILSTGSFNLNRGMLFSNSGVDILIEQAASEMDQRNRRNLYFTLQDIVAEEAPISPIYHDMTVYAARDYVKNFCMDFNFRPNLHSVRFE